MCKSSNDLYTCSKSICITLDQGNKQYGENEIIENYIKTIVEKKDETNSLSELTANCSNHSPLFSKFDIYTHSISRPIQGITILTWNVISKGGDENKKFKINPHHEEAIKLQSKYMLKRLNNILVNGKPDIVCLQELAEINQIYMILIFNQ